MDVDRGRGDRQRWLLDGLLGLALLAIGLAGTAPAGENQGVHAGPAAYPPVVVAALAVTVRRRWPLPTLAVVAAVTTAYLMLGQPYGPILLAFLVAVYTVAAHRPVRVAAVAGAVVLAALLAYVLVGVRPPGPVGLMPVAAWVVVPFAVGVTVRLSREAAARSRTDEARRLADAERLRVAREVHDVVGHGLAAIHLQAEVALHLLARRPEQAEVALTAISRTSKEALDELRVTLTVVRREEPADERAPVPGLGQLPQLRERLAGAGVPVTVETTGAPRPLPVAVDLAAYRVAQEALTNVLRHAGPATATVRVGYAPGELTVEVTDTGRGPVARPDRPTGSGLAGMRERVTALGGTFTAGPAPPAGFRVYATLPTGEAT
ncbi:sensor histidine kinase [Micromonospora sp. WMMD1128]|uniref:sensor histidine kinase n=1 Tax=Micromonospora sp. WMMD1128 TaxID=3015150 RepID=UPI00248CD272|nr:sensor histidine kinase [Micromonospora sp. WMMD1128]WBB72317.1 sensor histidine kinase [Micromonospora sp. WMMD1128]